MIIDEDEIRRRQLTEPEQLVGKTIARVWTDFGSTVAITFDDGTYAFLEAKDGRYDDELAELNWSDRPDSCHLLHMGVITEDQREELERRDNERREARLREEERRIYEFYKAKVEEQTQPRP
jgi:hypothetical protein